MNDGRSDILVATKLEDDPELILQDFPCPGGGATTFAATPILVADNGVRMDVDELAGDGVPDVLPTKMDIGSPPFPDPYLRTNSLGPSSPSPPVTFSETFVSPTFACPVGKDLSLIVVAILNSDGFMDVVAGCDGSVLLFPNDAANSFSARISAVMIFVAGVFSKNLELPDVHNDDGLDVVASEADATYYAPNLGGGSFAAPGRGRVARQEPLRVRHRL